MKAFPPAVGSADRMSGRHHKGVSVLAGTYDENLEENSQTMRGKVSKPLPTRRTSSTFAAAQALTKVEYVR